MAYWNQQALSSTFPSTGKLAATACFRDETGKLRLRQAHSGRIHAQTFASHPCGRNWKKNTETSTPTTNHLPKDGKK
eukprot:4868196-Amphidinium_carterae.1